MTGSEGRPNADRTMATGGASYTVRDSYGASTGSGTAQGGGDRSSGSRAGAPENPTKGGRHQGAPTAGEEPQHEPPRQPARRPRRRPRNDKPRQRTRFINVRVDSDEYAEITNAARARDVATARFLAAAGLAAARGNTPVEANEHRDAQITELVATRAQLARVGNNLNQLTRLANSGEIPGPSSLARTLEHLNQTMTGIDLAADSLVSRRTG